MGDLRSALDWLIPLLKERSIPFHITGGFAAHLYGANRSVNDIDIDLPTPALISLKSAIDPYIQDPPQRYKDATWDIYVCTLNYQGQLIDLTGDSEAYISNKHTGGWDPLTINFDKVIWVNAFGHRLPLQNPDDLLSYKLKIKYDELKHLADVEAIRLYIHNKRLHSTPACGRE